MPAGLPCIWLQQQSSPVTAQKFLSSTASGPSISMGIALRRCSGVQRISSVDKLGVCLLIENFMQALYRTAMSLAGWEPA